MTTSATTMRAAPEKAQNFLPNPQKPSHVRPVRRGGGVSGRENRAPVAGTGDLVRSLFTGRLTVDVELVVGCVGGLSDQVRTAVAGNVRHARRLQGLSIRDLAERSGVSKALLSQLERGLANPTVEVLAAVAEALELSFADITRTPLYEPVVIRRAPALDPDAAGMAARTLLSSERRSRFELYESTLPAGQVHESAPHGRGSEEFAYVLSGAVTLETETWTVRLRAGEAVRFSAEADHSYRAAGRPARLLTLVSMPLD